MTRVNDSTQLESRFLVSRTRLESRWEKWSLDSSHAFHRSQSMTRDSSQNHFYKIFEFLIDKPSSFAHKNMSTFTSMMIKLGALFPFWLSRAMLHFTDQVFPTFTQVDLKRCLHWGAQYIDNMLFNLPVDTARNNCGFFDCGRPTDCG